MYKLLIGNMFVFPNQKGSDEIVFAFRHDIKVKKSHFVVGFDFIVFQLILRQRLFLIVVQLIDFHLIVKVHQS